MFTCNLQARSYILRNDIIYHIRYEYVIVTPYTLKRNSNEHEKIKNKNKEIKKIETT